ncbi:MAG: hypothetical protein MR013_04335 [Prevotella sp.]|nr:hypothetical protein [Prevotella sp.]
MKKVIISMILCCLAVCGYAQEHLSFKGIPIEGSITEFCQKLKAKGFIEMPYDGDMRLFQGKFTGRKVTVGVIPTDIGENVSSIGVTFEKSDSWKDLVNLYEYYKYLYIEKYGFPTECVENNPSSSDSNSRLMYNLSQGKVSYFSKFEIQGGIINISIQKFDDSDGMVMILYLDTQDMNAKRQRELEDI